MFYIEIKGFIEILNSLFIFKGNFKISKTEPNNNPLKKNTKFLQPDERNGFATDKTTPYEEEDEDEHLANKIKTMMEEKNHLHKVDNSRFGQKEITAEEIHDFHNNNAKDLEDHNSNEEVTSETPTIKSQTSEKITLTTTVFKPKGEFKKRYPQAIIAGVKKSGTRALLSFLSRHPMVKSAGKEMHFFDRNDTYKEGLDWYLDQMPESYENELTIEKTPGYFVKPYVPKRIYEFSKAVKLIFIFREPVERAISDYAQALANERQIKFEKTVLTKTKPRKVNGNSSKVNIGMYSKHLINWLQYFPRMQMLFLDGNKFIKNPVPGIIKVQKFLNLPVLLNEESFIYNKTKGFFCAKNISGSSSTVAEAKCLGDSKGRTHPRVKDSALRKLKEFYKPLNEKFFEIIGQTFDWSTVNSGNSAST